MRASQRSHPRTDPCSSYNPVAIGLPPLPTGLPGTVPALRRRSNALEQVRRLASPRCPRRPHVLVPAACSRLCLVLLWQRRRRCGAGTLAPPVPAIIRGFPAPPRTAPPTSVAVCPHTPGGSRFRRVPGHKPGLQRARCARSSHAPPGAGRAHTGACQHPGGPLLGHGAVVGVCGPACLRTSGAGTARAGDKAHARAWGTVRWLASRMGAARPHAPRRSLRSGVGRAVFY